jgi:hypothetical protein
MTPRPIPYVPSSSGGAFAGPGIHERPAADVGARMVGAGVYGSPGSRFASPEDDGVLDLGSLL